MAGAANLVVPEYGSFLDGWDNRLEKNTARRAENRKALQELGDLAAQQGVVLDEQGWANLGQSLLGTNDFLNSTAVAPDMLAAMRQTQNSKAAMTLEERRRAQFKTDQEEANAMEADVAKQAEAGKSEAEIASYLTATYGDRAEKVVPRVNMLMNKAMLNGQQQGMQFGANLWTEDDAKAFIDSNPSLTAGMREGVMNAARKNQTDLENKIHQAGVEAGNVAGVVDNETMRRGIEARIPPTIKDQAYRAKLVDDAMKVAQQVQQAKIAGTQFNTTSAAQDAWARNAPTMAAEEARMQAQDDARRQSAAKAQEQSMTATLAQQDQLAQMIGKDKKYNQAAKEKITALLSQYVVSDVEKLAEAVHSGDRAAMDRIIAQSPTRAAYQDRARRLSDFINNSQHIPNFDAAVSSVQDLAVDPGEISRIGATYQRLSSAAGSAAQSSQTITRKVRVPVTNEGGAVVGYTMEERSFPVAADGTTSKQQQVDATTAQNIRSSFVKDGAELIQASQRALQAAGRFDATPEQIQGMAASMARRQAQQFVAGMGLKGEAAETMANQLAGDIINRVGALSGTFRVPSALDTYRSTVQRMRDQGGVLSPSNIVPGSVAPSPRLGPGGAAPAAGGAATNQWWNR